jgi:hypothetical protein
VFVICLSPAATGTRPDNRWDKRIFFCESATVNAKKDYLSLTAVFVGEDPLSAAAQRRAKYPALAERAARCSYPANENTGATL